MNRGLVTEHEDPGEDITEPYEPLDPETVEQVREHGIEFPDWTPTIPDRGHPSELRVLRVKGKGSR